jgi:hypothetical protein
MNENDALVERIRAVQGRIEAATARSGRTPGSARLVAVSKTMPAAVVAAAVRAGLSLFGENRVQEAAGKIPAVASIEPGRTIAWHLVGHLQSNKAKAAVPLFELIHSVDDAELARRLDRAAAEMDRTPGVLLQVNVAGEATKSGVSPAQLGALVDTVAALPHLVLRGLMTIPPHEADPEASRRHFAALREQGEIARVRAGAAPAIGIAAGAAPGSGLAAGAALAPPNTWELSMGMTEDFEVAIEEGATLVRVGRALFGERG